MPTNNKTKVARVVRAIQKRGCSDDDFRYCVHEACHALDTTLVRSWTNGHVHEALEEYCDHDRGRMMYYEVRARAVEMLACQRLDVPYELEHWAGVCFMESIQNMHITLPSFEWLVAQIKRHAEMTRTAKMVDRILELR